MPWVRLCHQLSSLKTNRPSGKDPRLWCGTSEVSMGDVFSPQPPTYWRVDFSLKKSLLTSTLRNPGLCLSSTSFHGTRKFHPDERLCVSLKFGPPREKCNWDPMSGPEWFNSRKILSSGHPTPLSRSEEGGP